MTLLYPKLFRFSLKTYKPVAIEQPIDMKIPENKFMLSFFLTAPDVENARKSINTTQGLRRCIKEGRLGGMAPKGYSNTKDENDNKIR